VVQQGAEALDRYLGAVRTPVEIEEMRGVVREAILETSVNVRVPQFDRIGSADVAVAFHHYDSLFFDESLRLVIGSRPLLFRLSTRASQRAGSLRVTSRPQPDGTRADSFEMTVSTTPLFESFREGERRVTAVGQECADRLDALQRIVEHETVHLAEHLRWGATTCSGSRFQGIAASLFGHRAPRHALVTPRERAEVLGFRPGQRVAFLFEGERRQGILNRVTKRATVLVPHPDGELLSDGHRYQRFYVPLRFLTQA
jgi:hypothetical protein